MIFVLAGEIGVEPWKFSLRELLWMADGAWSQTAEMLAITANINRKKGAKAYKGGDLNPRRQREIPTCDIKMLKMLVPKDG